MARQHGPGYVDVAEAVTDNVRRALTIVAVLQPVKDRVPTRSAVGRIFESSQRVLVLFPGAVKGDDNTGLAREIKRGGEQVLDLSRRPILAVIRLGIDAVPGHERVRGFVEGQSVEYLWSRGGNTVLLAAHRFVDHDKPQVKVGVAIERVKTRVLVTGMIFLNPARRHHWVGPNGGGLEIFEVERVRQLIIAE